jgi:Tfp pilus assembly protein PilF
MEAEARRAVSDPRPTPDRPEMNAVARAILGAALLRQGRHAEAAVELRAAVAADPRVIPAHGLLALALLRTGDREAARAALLELKRRAPDSPLADEILREMDRRP